MTTFFSEQPYFDDFDEDKNFMRVLFKPGFSVQSRELTQLQTILSSQIEKFGNHIFQSGTPVTGGKVSVDDQANYLVLNSQYLGNDITPESFLNKEIVFSGTTKTVRAKVIAVDTVSLATNPILILYYLDGEKFVESDTIKISNENVFATVRSTSAVGRSYIASIQEGVYYFKGHFVKVLPQFLVLETFHVPGYGSSTILNNPNYKVGLEFEEDIITSDDDISLLDPAQGAFNYQAPGADRFKINVRLNKRKIDSSDLSNFFEIIRIIDLGDGKVSKITKEVKYPIYTEIEKTLARRTFDESGNYTVNPFILSLEDSSSSSQFNAVLDPGKAYVQGFEFETVSPTKIIVDRAREFQNVNEYTISTNYSNYIVLNDVTGVLDIEDYPLMDIHCVERTSVNTTTQAAYNSTKIGTLRASNIDYNDSTNSTLGNTHSFVLHVFEANTSPITGTLPSTAGVHSNTRIVLPSGFSANLTANAFANAYFRITDGAGLIVGPLLILSSNATTINIESGLTFTPSANTFTIDSDIKVAKSIVRNVSSSIVFAGTVDDDSKKNGQTIIASDEKDRKQLVFTLQHPVLGPYEAVKDNTINNVDFFVKKVYEPSVSSSTGVITISAEGTDVFPFYPGGASPLSDLTILDNIVCFVKPTSAGNAGLGIFPGRVLSLANNNFSVTMTADNTIEANVSIPNIDATFVITTKINNAETTSRNLRKKSLKPTSNSLHALIPYELNTGGVQGTNILYSYNSTNNVFVSGVGTVFVDSTSTDSANDIGAIFFSEPQILTDLRTPGKAVSLQVPDVYKIVRITDSRDTSLNVSSAMLTNDSHDVTSRYDFDNGQRPMYYDHATIKLKRGSAPPTGRVFVQFQYFKHLPPSGDTEGFFTVDSYLQTGSNITYGQIPKTYDQYYGDYVSSRSTLDFRPTRQIGSTNLSGALNVDPNREATVGAFDYYTSRIDHIVIKPSKEFFIVKGESAIVPAPPSIEEGDMLIYTITIPAYTADVNDIRVKFYENRRFTMRDVGNIQDRVKNLEYYVSLDTLEKETESLKILDANGLERSKYGFFVDNFKTYLTQANNLELKRQDYNRNLIENGELKPASLKRTVSMRFGVVPNSGNYKLSGTPGTGVITCDYTESSLNGSSPLQDKATKTQTVAGALFAKFNGRGRLYPDADVATETSYLPQININPVNGLNEVLEFVDDSLNFISTTALTPWLTDPNNPLARIPDRQSQTRVQRGLNPRTFRGPGGTFRETTTRTSTFLPAGTTLTGQGIEIGDPSAQEVSTVSDVSVVPWIKPSPLLFNAGGLRANTTYYHFFDGVNIDKNIIVPNSYNLRNSDNSVINDRLLLQVDDDVILANSVGEITNLRNRVSSSGTRTGHEFLWKVAYVDHINKRVGLVKDFSEPGNPQNYIIDISSSSTPGSVNRYIGTIGTVNDSVIYYLHSLHEHRSGITQFSANGANQIKLLNDAPSVNITGNTINLIHNFKLNPITGTLVQTNRGTSSKPGQILTRSYTVIAYDTANRIATLNQNIDQSMYVTSNNQTQGITYSIGRNKSSSLGEVSGLFWLDSGKFRTGQRILRVTESFNNSYDTDAISFADMTHVSNSLKVQKSSLLFSTYNVGVGTQREVLSSDYVIKTEDTKVTNFTPDPPPPVETVDPLAQTFEISKRLYPDGVFLSSVDLFFRNKDSRNIPVTIEIRSTVNGTPHSSEWLAESVVIKFPDEVVLTDNPDFKNPSTKTTFTFPTPVFLRPGFYALVIKTDSPDYTVWVAEKGALSLDGKVVDINPYMGTLYKSQNAMEYTPIINEDLMFDIKRCKFITNSTGTVYFNNDLLRDQFDAVQAIGLTPAYKLPVDSFRFNKTAYTPNPSKATLDFSYISTPYGGTTESSYRPLTDEKISCGDDLLYPVGQRRKQVSSFSDFIVRARLLTGDDKLSPVIALSDLSLDTFENFINNAQVEYSSNTGIQNIVIVSGGAGYTNSNTVTITSDDGSSFLANIIVNDSANGNIVSLNVTSSGSGYTDNFTLVYPNANNSNTVTANAVIVPITEYSSAGGPCLARYITKKVTLAEGFDSGDIKVLLDANLPEGADINVYFKARSSSDNTPFEDRTYAKMVLASIPPAPALSSEEYVELEYRPTLNDGFVNYTGNNGVTYDTFREFSIKITMTSSDPSVIPKIKNLRVVAMPGE